MHDIDRAQILVEALPYIQKYNNKTIVVKYGGNAMINEDLKRAVISDIVLLKLVGINVVVVHGGGPEINDMLKKTGKESKFVNGLRYTDKETLDIVQMVLCGKVNKDLVGLISQMGGRAVGLCGIDGGIISANRLTEPDTDYGYVGDIASIDPALVNSAIENGYIPVISTVAQGIDDPSTSYNINADTAAAKLACALNAEKLILLTDVRGILKNAKDDSSLISTLTLSQIPRLIKEGVISGGMIPKLDCCIEAVRKGVVSAHILDGRISHSILIETLSDSGIGTMITA